VTHSLLVRTLPVYERVVRIAEEPSTLSHSPVLPPPVLDSSTLTRPYLFWVTRVTFLHSPVRTASIALSVGVLIAPSEPSVNGADGRLLEVLPPSYDSSPESRSPILFDRFFMDRTLEFDIETLCFCIFPVLEAIPREPSPFFVSPRK